MSEQEHGAFAEPVHTQITPDAIDDGPVAPASRPARLATTRVTVDAGNGDVWADRAFPGGFGSPDVVAADNAVDGARDRRTGRRALWISVGAVAVLAAVSIPITMHLRHRVPAAVHAPEHVAGLSIDHSTAAADTADYLRSAVAASLGLDTSVGAVYTDGATGADADAHSVIYVGGTTAQGTDASQVTALLALMDDSADGVDQVTTEGPGPLGGVMKCAMTTATTASGAPATSDTEMAVCAFADHGDVGLALFPNRTISQSAELLRRMRPALAK